MVRIPDCAALHPGYTHSLHRHCDELLRRSNPDGCRGDSLDCFAPLAMTACAVVLENGASRPLDRPLSQAPPSS
uniref:Uncharacterized protein n=1 Tax=Bradyrhizobium amphicarpaeae TaxID=1404768 RepID=A0A2U8Q2H7_9BRAD|nr:hypothetical protein CIT40_28025 [Bradyrhizobium amphicarpaeae]